jgi:hypothetical protein
MSRQKRSALFVLAVTLVPALGRWLVGISGGFTKAKGGHESWFTSTYYFRDWIERQKRDPSIN